MKKYKVKISKIEHDSGFKAIENKNNAKKDGEEYDYVTPYAHLIYSVASISKMGCVAIFIHSEVFNANSKTEKFELKIFNDSNAKCIKIPYYESYQCKSISLNDSNLMLHFESEARNSFTQLYNFRMASLAMVNSNYIYTDYELKTFYFLRSKIGS